MRSLFKFAFSLLAGAIIPLFIGSSLLALTQSIPIDKDLSRVVEAPTSGFPKSDHETLSLGKIPLYDIDSFSECVSIGQIFNVSDIPYGFRPTLSQSGVLGVCEDLRLALIEGGDQVQYARFFHGASAIIHVGLQALNLSQLRVLVSTLLIGLLLLILYEVGRHFRPAAVFLSLYFFLISEFVYQGFSLTHGLSTLLGLTGLYSALIGYKHLSDKYFLALCSSAGAVYALVAQLYTPLVFPILFSIALIGAPRAAFASGLSRNSLLWRASVSWVIGYGVAMIARFIWVGQALGWDVAVSEWTEAATSRVTSGFFQIIELFAYQVIGQTLSWPLRSIGFLALIFLIGLYIGKTEFGIYDAIRAWRLVIPSALGIVWFSVLGGHGLHPWVSNLVNAIVLGLSLPVLGDLIQKGTSPLKLLGYRHD